MNIAFTGPRSGFSDDVAHRITKQFSLFVGKEIRWMHGVCTGADERFHWLLEGFLYKTDKKLTKDWSLELFPSNLPHYVGTTLATIKLGIHLTIHPPMPPLKRNVLMARECHVLWAAPVNWIRMRSGTWYTILQVEKLAKPIEYFVDDK